MCRSSCTISSVWLAAVLKICLVGARSCDNCPTVGVYYYPWYLKSNNFHGGQYLRRDLDPPFQPALGDYDGRNSTVLNQHFQWSRQANIEMWATSWWGIDSVEDVTTRDFILAHPDLGDLQIAVHYEPYRPGVVTEEMVYNEFAHMAQNYFGHPNYYRIDDKPVVIVYLARQLQREGKLETFTNTMRLAASAHGFDEIYLMGDMIFQYHFGQDPCRSLDAITVYDVYGAVGKHPFVERAGVGHFFEKLKGWQKAARRHKCGFIPAVSPGFNDASVRSGHVPTSRKLSETSDFGSLFRALLQSIKLLTDPDADRLLMVTTFNEWHEDTQIEPVVASSGDIAMNETVLPPFRTSGLSYEAYGTRYLDILHDETVNPEGTEFSFWYSMWFRLGILIAFLFPFLPFIIL